MVANLALAASADSWDFCWVGRAGLTGSDSVEHAIAVKTAAASALISVVPLTMGITARVKAGMGVALPASMVMLSLWVAFVELASSLRP